MKRKPTGVLASPLVLVLDRSADLRRQVREAIRVCCGTVLEGASVSQAVPYLEEHEAGAIILGDVSDGTDEALAWVRSMRKHHRQAVFIHYPLQSTEELAIASLKAGVDDYVRRPDGEGLAQACSRLLSAERAASSAQSCMMGHNPAIARARDYIAKLARMECHVLVCGETGTGKELVARSVHAASLRQDRPLVAVNCAAIPDALLESELFGCERGAFTGAHERREGHLLQATGGTLFLDEIGEMSLYAQAKLLRVTETKRVERLGGRSEPVDVRLIAATNRDLDAMVRQGLFRADLFFRLAVTQIRLPPLRERAEDIPLLCHHFLEELNQRLGIALNGFEPETMEALMHHSWPGNVRELRNLMEAIAVEKTEGDIALTDLPAWFSSGLKTGQTASQRTVIQAALERTRGNKSQAAAELNLSRMTLYRRIAKYGIGAP